MFHIDIKKRIFGIGVLSLLMLIFSTGPRLLAQDDDFDFDFDDDIFGDDSGYGAPAPSYTPPPTGGGFGGFSSGGADDFTVHNKVKYFNDDPADDKRYKDPFKALVVKQAAPPPVPTIRADSGPAPTPELIPQLNLSIVGVVESGDRKLALITLDNEMHSMMEGDSVPGKFRVVSIDPDSVTVFSYRSKTRRILKIGGGEL